MSYHKNDFLKYNQLILNQPLMKQLLLCFSIALSFSLLTYGQIGIAQPTDYEVCDDNGNGIGIFDLSIKDTEILNGLDSQDYLVSYHFSLADANTDVGALPSPYTNIANPQTIYARVEEISTDNFEVTSFNLIVNSVVQNGFTTEQIACGVDGFAIFDLTLSSVELIGADANLSVQYYLTLSDAMANTNVIFNPNAYTNTVAYSQEIYVRIENVVTGCFYASPNTILYLNVVDQPDFNQIAPLEACDLDGDGFTEFDVDSKTDEILSGSDANLFYVTYYETQADADDEVNPLVSPYVNIVAFNQTIYARVAAYYDNCYQVLPLDLVVITDCVLASSVTLSFCEQDPNADELVDLTAEESVILNGQNPIDHTITYYEVENDAQNGINAIPNPQEYTVVSTFDTTLFVRVENNQSGNFTVTTFNILFDSGPQVTLNDSYTICNGNSIVLTPSINGSQAYSFLWSTGATDPEIVVEIAGVYTVTVTDNVSGCYIELSTEVFESNFPDLGQASDLSSCEPNSVFDLTVTLNEVLNGLDIAQFDINFFNNINNAYSNVEPILDPTNYAPSLPQETLYIRVQNIGDDCFEILGFNIIIDNSCPIEFECSEGIINNSFCYDNNNQTQYTYQSVDGLPLQIIFNSGQVEVNFDALVVLDSDGITNLNPEATAYGNDGDLTGLTFTSTGNSITITVAADEIFSCSNQNYTPIDYDVSCADPNALPTCNATLQTPEDGAIDVEETTGLSWNNASGIVDGYKLSIGLTSGGTEVLDHEDIGDVTSYDLETLDYETTYYVTIVPYNVNGDAEGCMEQSFTTRANPYQVIVCEDGTVNTIHCYDNDDTTEFSFQSSDGLPLTIIFNSGSTEVNFDEVYIVDSDGTILNPDLEYGNNGDFTGLSYTSSGDNLTVRFDSDFTISCSQGSSCCTEQFDFDVFCASSVGFIQVNAFVDANTNNINDTSEFSFSNGYFTYEVNGDGMINTVNSSTGSFQIISGNATDTYDVTFNLYDESEACYDITTTSFSNISVATGSTITLDFPVVEEQSCEDLAVYLINNWAPPRPGFTHDNYLYIENLGFTTIVSGTVEFVIDPQLVYNNTFSVNPAYTVTNTATGFTVDFVNLQPSDVESIGISITCPVNVALDDIVTNTASYLTDSSDLVASNNYSTLSEVVVGSWDPNDKMEAHGPRVLYEDFVTSDEWLYYTIRFQNLGTAEAIFVRIEDALDDQLDESTFQMLRSSHDYVVTRTERDLEWYFDDINLPAEQDDAEGSNGFVYFRVKPLAGYGIGDVIPNTAAIYFDFNAPVITNRFETEFVTPLSIVDLDAIDLNVFPNPANDRVTISLNNTAINDFDVTLVDIQGKMINVPQLNYNDSIELNVSSLNAGLYFVQLKKGNQTIVEKLIIE